jgi:hypothetical protein
MIGEVIAAMHEPKRGVTRIGTTQTIGVALEAVALEAVALEAVAVGVAAPGMARALAGVQGFN